jgi:hypothetical protein
MPSSVQLKLDCVPRVLAFCRRHPDLCAAARQACDKLEALSARTRALFAKKLRAHGELAAAIAARGRIQGPLVEELTQVVRLARAAALHEGGAELGASLRFDKISADIPVDRAQAVLERALRHRELLDRYGMPAGMLDRLGEAVGEYAAVVEQRIEASATIAGANAGLEMVAAEALLVIKHLDALLRIRFSGDPVRQAEWRLARRVRWDKPKMTEPEDGRRV